MDGTALCAPRPSILRAASHTSPPPRRCSESRTGSSGMKAGKSWKKTSGNPESKRAATWSSVQLREPERSQFRLGDEIGERNLERSRSSDQNHVISYSHTGKRRISAQQANSGQLTQAALRSVAVHGTLDHPTHGHTHSAGWLRAGNCESDQRPTAVKPLAAHCGLEVAFAAQPKAPLHGGLRG
jgi:hypothetical protein